MSRALASVAFVSLWATACTELGPPEVDGPARLGGVEVDADILNRGRRAYNVYCANCHGARGDGMGAIGYQQTPRARDLTLGIIKFASVPAGQLPTDADLERVVRRGLAGTGMLAWPVPEDELRAVIHWVKYLSPRWHKEAAGTPIVVSPDPWVGREAEAELRGGLLYSGPFQCTSCHPGRITDSPFGKIASTDFGRDPLRAGAELEDLYRAIAAGVGGTAMPTWQGAVPEADLWAVAYYTKKLSRSAK